MKTLRTLVSIATCLIPLGLIPVAFLFVFMSMFGYDGVSQSGDYFQGSTHDLLTKVGTAVHFGSPFVISAICLWIAYKNIKAVKENNLKKAVIWTVVNVFILQFYLFFLFLLVQFNMAV